jgi:hypothetical protein
MSMKFPMTQAGIEPATFRFVAQRLKPLAPELFFLILAQPVYKM